MQEEVTMVSAIALTTMILQGCDVSYKLLNKEEFITHQTYNNDKMPFRMKSSDLYAPLLSKNNRFNIETAMGGGIGIKTSFDINKKFCVLLKYSYRYKEDNIEYSDWIRYVRDSIVYPKDSASYHKIDTLLHNYNFSMEHILTQNIFEIGCGIFRADYKNIRWDLFGGIVYGEVKNKYTFPIPEDSANSDIYKNSSYAYGIFTNDYRFQESRKYIQTYLQGDCGYITKRTEGVLITRLSYFNFFNQRFLLDYPVPIYEAKSSGLLLEPAVRFGLGNKEFRVFIQYEAAIPIVKTDIKWYASQLKGGISLRFNNKKYK